MAWNPGGPGNDATGHLFDQWLAALQTKNAGRRRCCAARARATWAAWSGA